MASPCAGNIGLVELGSSGYSSSDYRCKSFCNLNSRVLPHSSLFDQLGKLPKLSSSYIRIGKHKAAERNPRRLHVAAGALQDAVSGAVVLTIVGAAATALVKLRKQEVEAQRKECESCKGTGLCSTCSGEGFVMKDLLPEVAAKAKQSATAANRNTAGLPNKWRYCVGCSGSRACLACKGRGWIPVS